MTVKTLTINPGIGSGISGTHAKALAKIKWNQTAIDVKVGGLLRSRIEECVRLAAEHAVDSIPDIPSPSVPGDFPSNWDHNLEESITYDVHGMLFDVRGRFGVLYTHADDGTYLIYALYLETGTVKMLPRPWVTLTLDEVWDDWQKILGGSQSASVDASTPMTFSMGG